MRYGMGMRRTLVAAVLLASHGLPAAQQASSEAEGKKSMANPGGIRGNLRRRTTRGRLPRPAIFAFP